VDILEEFADGFAHLEEGGLLERTAEGVELTRKGLLEVDRHLPEFFEPEHRNTRYT
jgi:oxygen-independent coproporphyrinogen-3 oxidase